MSPTRPLDCPDESCFDFTDCDECLADCRAVMETLRSKSVGTLGDRMRVTWSQKEEN